MLHFLTIGQAPRPDATPEILEFMGIEDGPVVEAGALDGLDRSGIPAPESGDMPLVTRLASGEEVLVGESFIERRMRALVDRVPPGDAAAILCTGPFPGIPERPGLVKAGPEFDRALAAACSPGMSVSILIPDPGQEEDARRRVPAGCRVLVGVGSPYSDDADWLPDGFGDADLVALNCLGYDGRMERALAAATGKRILLARRVLAERLAEAAA